MNQLNLFIELTRLKKPIGFMLLFWPCAWGLTIAYDFSTNLKNYYFYLLLFFFGAVLMRSAGCIVNDILDKEFDKKVFRTKDRPVASGKISVKLGITYALILCFCALLILLNFNTITIILAIGSMPLAFTYPLMKRFTYWPQLFLGITFNYGLLLGWTSINESLNIIPTLFYIGAIFWTLGYDTIYGFQDIKDDEIIGLKSTSIKFKKKPFIFLLACYVILFSMIIALGILEKFNIFYYAFSLIIGYHLFLYQLKSVNLDNPMNCLKVFKSNNLLGFLVFIQILIGKI
ncbi:4-hydroxybenzoate octaprenyltransferase [Candidatus Pelagibacter communis]|uniref:4-hydroxybenzoate octaprenyltransferase n=1 Tax=Pelagibacter ubique TaxID=198252 RepID=UPI00092D0C6B|nr:4-hydroxybenzoate octaprenyltransferase [Candidatus Pelagibacter ubique]